MAHDILRALLTGEFYRDVWNVPRGWHATRIKPIEPVKLIQQFIHTGTQVSTASFLCVFEAKDL